MTFSPPTEPQHFRGKTLTPESPIPVHIPEPHNIPVLENQIDPIFNLMSTHMEQVPALATFGRPESHSLGLIPSVSESYEARTIKVGDGVGGEDYSNLKSGSDQSQAMAHGNGYAEERNAHGILQNHLTSNTQQPVSVGAYESLSAPAENKLTSLTPFQTHDPNAKSLQTVSLSPEHPQDVSVSQGPATTAPGTTGDSDAQSQTSNTDVNGDGVSYQAVLENLSPSIITAPTAEKTPSITTNIPQTPISTLPIPTGLPPRPPPQEKPSIHPNYTPGEDIRSYHHPQIQQANGSSSYSSQSNNSYRAPQGYSDHKTVAPNGLPPPPLATFQQPSSKASQSQPNPQPPQLRERDEFGRNVGRAPPAGNEGEVRLMQRADVETEWKKFLADEAVYTSEGLWDRFPPGSRLFVGNLFAEQVTKRHLFDIFHTYGRLAQISIKSAYGFVQYIDVGCSNRALEAEQGRELKGKTLHLEISKPQKNSRNAAATADGDRLRARRGRRSRSPDYGRGGPMRGNGQRPGADRFERGPAFNDRRIRDDYRPIRSPSPRVFRGRDEYRGGRRSPEGYYGNRRSRSRSSYNRAPGGRYRSLSPRPRDPDDEADLPISRRNPRDVPDVQMILVDEVDRTFVGYIQQSFSGRGLRCDVLQMPRVSLAAVVKRQIIEGVQAVVKIFRKSQVTGKIPLQVFNRSSGANNVRFDEYDDLDANIATELVVRAKSTHLAPAPVAPQYPTAPYGAPQYSQPPQQLHPQSVHQQPEYGQAPQQIPPQQMHQQSIPHQQPPTGGAPSESPHLSNLIGSLDGPSLQKLLGAMANNPQNSQLQIPQQPHHQQDLASLLGSIARQQPPQQQQQQQQQQGNPYGGPPQPHYPHSGQAPNSQFATDQAVTSVLNNINSSGRAPHQGMHPQQAMLPQYQQPGQQSNVQSIMEQLARYPPRQ